MQIGSSQRNKKQNILDDRRHKTIDLWDVLSELYILLCISSDVDYIWGGGEEHDHSINLLLDKSNFQGCWTKNI
jgi:hypothetical protein